MIYPFRCLFCGNYEEIIRHHSESGLGAICSECGQPMNRVYSVPNVNVPKMGEYNPGLGCVVNSRKDIRDAQRRIKYETGREVIEVGNEKVNVKPRLSEYDFPRGVFDDALRDV